MHILTIDTEHEPGSVAIVEVDDLTPDRQTSVVVLGSAGDPPGDCDLCYAQDIAADVGWLVSGPWELTGRSHGE